MNWEYKTIHKPEYVADNEDDIDEMLDGSGGDGWELIAIYRDEWFIFKRPKLS